MTVLDGLAFLLFIYILVLFARAVLTFTIGMARDWKPKGVGLVFVECVFALTDPPIKALRKIFRPVQLGTVRFDLAFFILMMSCLVLFNFLSWA